MNPDNRKYNDIIMTYNGVPIGEIRSIEAKVEPRETCVECGLDKTYNQFVYGEEPVCIDCYEKRRQKYSSNLLTKDKDNDIIDVSKERENDSMKTYTLGEVIDKLEIGQIALKVAGIENKVLTSENFGVLKFGQFTLFVDENDNNIVKSLNGALPVFVKSKKESNKYRFIILDREDYEDLMNKLK